jgi:hypothetical protein
MSEIANRPEPPRMNRRHKVWREYNPDINAWRQLQLIAEALRYAGLVAELDVTGNEVELYAARRVKQGKKE